MGLLGDRDRAALRGRLGEELVADVRIHLFTQKPSPLFIPGRECPSCPSTRQLLEEVAALSDKIHLEVHDFYSERELCERDGIDRIPAITFDLPEGGRLRFFGPPAGYEFSTFVGDLIYASGRSTGLSPKTLATLAELEDSLHIRVFVTPT